MGSLTVPSEGLVYVDAQIAIYTVDRHPKYGPACMPLWSAAAAGAVTVVSSELILLETLVGPIRAADAALERDREGLWGRPNTLLLPVTRAVLREAARLRAAIPPLKAPDAIHAATAMLSGCALFVTNDAAFRHIPGLPIAMLDDALSAP
ncbi:MAG: PIN domain-containing protein [Armatimonadetes bacterium]|nr:PIN domain-containing protein [Armatimonadota bacterium]